MYFEILNKNFEEEIYFSPAPPPNCLSHSLRALFFRWLLGGEPFLAPPPQF